MHMPEDSSLPDHVIRPARDTDIPGILAMASRLIDLHVAMDPHRYVRTPDIMDRYAAWLPERMRDPLGFVLVAEAPRDTSTSSLMAYCVGGVDDAIPIYWSPRCGWIIDLWVEPEHRRSGLASSVVDAALKRFHALGIDQVRAETAAHNDAVRAMFIRCGFRVASVEMMRQSET